MTDSWKIRNKYTQETIGEVELLNQGQVEEKLAKAQSAFEKHKGSSAEERHQWLTDLAHGIEEKREKIRDLIIQEAGKPYGYADTEVDRCLMTIRWAAEETRRLGGEVVPMDFGGGKGKEAYTKRFPMGVLLGISPFNFPLNLAMHKIAPSIASGNTILIKPSPYTPLTLLEVEKIANDVGLPEGLFQIVPCSNEVSEHLVTHEDISLLSFTGSPKVGWQLKEKAGKKKVILELGGNAGVLIDETVELDDLVETLLRGVYLYAGQICISTQRIFVVDQVKDQLIEKLVKGMDNLKVGDPSDKEVTVGPIIDEKHLKRIDDWIQKAVQGGAKVLKGGKILDEAHHVYEPTLLTNTSPDMLVSCEEAFGPLAIIEGVKNFDEGLKALNNTKYGLQAGVFTNHLDRMKEAFERVVVGGLMINNVPGFRIDHMPYGGIKDSGLGREGLKYTMAEMTEPRLLIF